MGSPDSVGAVILFDGICNLCNGAVQFILKRDKVGYFRFAALQSEVAQGILEKSGFINSQPETLLLVHNSNVYQRSGAILEIARRLNHGWPILYILKYVPVKLRDAIYSWIASRRYQWFGKREACMVPDPKWADRFL